MIFYIAIYFLLFSLVLWESFGIPIVLKKFLFVCSIIFFILLSGLRWRTGADWSPYYDFFKLFDSSIDVFYLIFEPGYTAIVQITKILGGSFTTTLIITAILVIALRGIFFLKYTKSLILALLLYWGNSLCDIVAVRQSIAISLCLLSLPLIIKQKKLAFVIITIVAMQFHISAVVFFLAYPIYHLKWSAKSQYFFLILSVVVGASGILSALLEGLGNISSLGRVASKAGAYKDSSTVGEGSGKIMSLILGLLKRALILPFVIFFKRNIETKNKFYSGFLNLFVFGNIIYFVVIDFLPVQRLAAYFYPLEIVLLCIIYDNSKKKPLLAIVFGGYALLKLIFMIQGSQAYIVPYYHIFMDFFPRDKSIINFR